MQFKRNVVLRIQPEFAEGLPAIDRAWDMTTGREAYMTSANDSQHNPGSLHPKGLAADFRIRDPGGAWALSQHELDDLISELRLRLNGGGPVNKPFQVVLEQDHIHIEYDPR